MISHVWFTKPLLIPKISNMISQILVHEAPTMVQNPRYTKVCKLQHLFNDNNSIAQKTYKLQWSPINDH
jgi:hypothetical protein